MNRFKEARKRMRLTQVAVQMRTGIEQTNLSKYELGKRIPTVDNLVILARLYNVNMEYLLDLTDDPKPLWRKGPKKQDTE